MASRPTAFPQWAIYPGIDPVSGENTVIEPPVGNKNNGWLAGEFPPNNWMNWLQRTTNNWVEFLDELTQKGLLKLILGMDYTTNGTDIINFNGGAFIGTHFDTGYKKAFLATPGMAKDYGSPFNPGTGNGIRTNIGALSNPQQWAYIYAIGKEDGTTDYISFQDNGVETFSDLKTKAQSDGFDYYVYIGAVWIEDAGPNYIPTLISVSGRVRLQSPVLNKYSAVSPNPEAIPVFCPNLATVQAALIIGGHDAATAGAWKLDFSVEEGSIASSGTGFPVYGSSNGANQFEHNWLHEASFYPTGSTLSIYLSTGNPLAMCYTLGWTDLDVI